MPKQTRSEIAKRAWENADEWNISTVMADLPHSIEIGRRNTKQSMKIKIWSGTDHVGTLSIGQGGVQWSYRNKNDRRQLDLRGVLPHLRMLPNR